RHSYVGKPPAVLGILIAGSAVGMAMSIPRMLLFPLAPSLALFARRLFPARGWCLAFTTAGHAGQSGASLLDRGLTCLLHRDLRAGESLTGQRGLQIVHTLFELTGALGVGRYDDGPYLIAKNADSDSGLAAFRVADLHSDAIGTPCRSIIA